jgi:hypothetical protein
MQFKYKANITMLPIEILPSRIRKNKTLSAKKVYVIQGEVRILKNVCLTIQDQATLLLINGIFKKSITNRSTLIFDQGSKLLAKRIKLKAANENFKPVKQAENGGLWFLGNFANTSKDGVKISENRKNSLSSFSAESITASYLGRKKQYVSPLTGKTIGIGDDIDGISVLGVGQKEWSIASIKSQYSADDGIDIRNSHLKLSHLEVISPAEDGINLSNSRLEIHKSLRLDIQKTSVTDRDLVDLETDDGACFLVLHSGCRVNLNGVFGDEMVLSSSEMPKPKLGRDNTSNYHFSGKLKKSALIYSIDQN